ncbi:hypothetical protein SISNIDRAFT_490918 [Sistotremastrum niveocremeum HHB9708]|uniref:Uncharacterized protein n=1 Tax=Sistotremastrum niveocremeum HHB9708 TaxID=1314777 RepID=A0A164NBY5_9AGAM|nr:hypothetical protein SISNIDRAFT_490918 [Sistotremastrum niveocremeum HHB9708]
MPKKGTGSPFTSAAGIAVLRQSIVETKKKGPMIFLLTQKLTEKGEDDVVDEYDGDEPDRKKFDDQLEDIASELARKYPVGNCTLHPEHACYWHRKTDRHFDIGHRPRCLVWANSILQNKCTYDYPPLTSTLFSSTQCLKVSAIKTNSHNSSNVQPLDFAGLLAAFAPGFAQNVNNARTEVSPPSPQIKYTDTIDEYAAKTGLSDAHKELLVDKFGFQVGDKFTSLTKEEWTKAGFKVLDRD